MSGNSTPSFSRHATLDAILRLVLYFDVFQHPLHQTELERLVCPGRPDLIQESCDTLRKKQLLEETHRFWHRPGAQRWVVRRQTRTRCAEKVWPIARRSAAILSGMPFVEGVLITGGMSKNSTTPDNDIDFLLLVTPNRVWSIKTITQALRRVLPHKYREQFCTNYIMATDAMPLSSRNLFTAIELSTAVPMHGPTACARLLMENQWVKQFVPGFSWSIQRAQAAPKRKSSRPVRALEATWRGPGALNIEQWALKGWNQYWNSKYNWLSQAQRSKRFQRTPSTATNHLHDFQNYVLRETQARFEEVGLKEELSL